MISILMPSRGRPQLLTRSIETLINNADNPDDLELCIRLDRDDVSLPEYRYRLPKLPLKKQIVITKERGSGYQELHSMLNDLAEKSSGEWLFVFNDDARIEKTNNYGWDTAIKNSGQPTVSPIVLTFWRMDQMNLFPVISRKLYEILGHLSLNAHTDSWLEEIGRATGIMKICSGARITHDREETKDLTHSEGRISCSITSTTYQSPEMKALRNRDIEAVRDWQSKH